MAKPNLDGKTVFAKFADKQAIPVLLEHLDESGIWFYDAGLLEDLFEDQPILKLEPKLQKRTLIFFPLARVEWILVSDTDAP